MSLAAVQPDVASLTPAPSVPPLLRGGAGQANADDGHAFARFLESSAGPADRTELRKAAEALVSTAFVQPVLAMLRDSPFNEDGPFAPGTGERRFRPMLDQHLADAITSASRFGLVDAIVDRYARAAATPDPLVDREA